MALVKTRLNHDQEARCIDLTRGPYYSVYERRIFQCPQNGGLAV
jgi:hypothetical protein